MTTRPDVDALRKALEASTPGEWLSQEYFWGAVVYLSDGQFMTKSIVGNDGSRLFDDVQKEALRNCEFIASAHNDLPALLAYIEHLENLCGKAEAVLKYQEYGGFSKEYVATLAQELRAVTASDGEGE